MCRLMCSNMNQSIMPLQFKSFHRLLLTTKLDLRFYFASSLPMSMQVFTVRSSICAWHLPSRPDDGTSLIWRRSSLPHTQYSFHNVWGTIIIIFLNELGLFVIACNNCMISSIKRTVDTEERTVYGTGYWYDMSSSATSSVSLPLLLKKSEMRCWTPLCLNIKLSEQTDNRKQGRSFGR